MRSIVSTNKKIVKKYVKLVEKEMEQTEISNLLNYLEICQNQEISEIHNM